MVPYYSIWCCVNAHNPVSPLSTLLDNSHRILKHCTGPIHLPFAPRLHICKTCRGERRASASIGLAIAIIFARPAGANGR